MPWNTQKNRNNLAKCLMLSVGLMISSTAQAYPEYQAYSQSNSGMGVSCGMCHVNPDGPDGAAHGQVGGLSKVELTRLNEARSAFEPGMIVNSPILNAFGNEMVKQLGRKKLIELKLEPAALATSLDPATDLDDDGVPDAQEFSEGTHPLHKSSGNPWLLFLHNLKRHPFPLTMVILATLCMLYGLRNLHKALELKSKTEDDDNDWETEEPELEQVQPHSQAATRTETGLGAKLKASLSNRRTISDKKVRISATFDDLVDKSD